MDNFLERLKVWINLNYKSYSDFARAMDMSRQHLGNYIAGTNKPSAEFFDKLVKLGCNITWLFNEEETKLYTDSEAGEQLSEKTGITTLSVKPKQSQSNVERAPGKKKQGNNENHEEAIIGKS